MKKSNKKAATVSFITNNNITYLGTLEGKTITGVNSPRLVDYIKARETGDLTTVIVGSKGHLTIEPLADTEQLELDRLESLWALAETKSKAWVTTQVFNKLTGK